MIHEFDHDWHMADAEAGIECRVEGDSVYLRHPDGTVEEMTWAEFDRWRGGGDDGES